MNREETIDLALLYAFGALSSEEAAHADRMLEAYHGRWGGDVSPVYAEDSY